MHRLQTVELLVESFRPDPNARFHDLGQPLGAMTRSLDAAAGAGNAPATIESFDSIHHPGHIGSVCRVAPILSVIAISQLSMAGYVSTTAFKAFRQL
jgi:hypothetical protein